MTMVPEDADERRLLMELAAAHLNVPPGSEQPFQITQNDRVGDAPVLAHPGFRGSDFLPDWRAARRLAHGGFIVFPDNRGTRSKTLLVTAKGLDAYQVMVRSSHQQQATTTGNQISLDLIKNNGATEPVNPPRPVDVFFAYSHKDESLLDEMREHLALLRRQGRIGEWYDRKIEAGEEWGRQIDQKLESCDLILLLVSASFMNSDYCFEKELNAAIYRHVRNEARVIPIILRPFDNWKNAPFGQLQALPRDGQAVMTWPNRDEAWVNVVAGIRKVVETLSRMPPRAEASRLTSDQPALEKDAPIADEIYEPGLVEYLGDVQKSSAEIWSRLRALDEFGPEFAKGPKPSALPSQSGDPVSDVEGPIAVFSELAVWLADAGSTIEAEMIPMHAAWSCLRACDVLFGSLLPVETPEDRERAKELLSTIPGHPEHFPELIAGLGDTKGKLDAYRGKSAELNSAVRRFERALQDSIEVLTEGRAVAAYLSEVLARRLEESTSSTT